MSRTVVMGVTNDEFWEDLIFLVDCITTDVQSLLPESLDVKRYVEVFWKGHLSRCRTARDTDLSSKWDAIRLEAWRLASSSFESEALRQEIDELYDDSSISQRLSYFGYACREGNGRRLRMELLSLLWLVSYFYGFRDEMLRSSMLRISTVTRCVPLGLSYWVYAGSILDEERYWLTNNLSCNDMYIVRPVFPELILSNNADDRGFRQKCLTLGLAYARLQVFLTAAAFKAHHDKYGSRAKLWLVAEHPVALRHDGAEFSDEWKECFEGVEDPGEIVRQGGGVFGSNSGITTFGDDQSLYSPEPKGPLYNGYVTERDNLLGRRRAIESVLLPARAPVQPVGPPGSSVDVTQSPLREGGLGAP